MQITSNKCTALTENLVWEVEQNIVEPMTTFFIVKMYTNDLDTNLYVSLASSCSSWLHLSVYPSAAAC